MAQTTERPAVIGEPTDVLPATTLSNSSSATTRADSRREAVETAKATTADALAAPQEHGQQQGPKGRKLLVILHGKRLDDDSVRNAILVGVAEQDLRKAGLLLQGTAPFLPSVVLFHVCKGCSCAVSCHAECRVVLLLLLLSAQRLKAEGHEVSRPQQATCSSGV